MQAFIPDPDLKHFVALAAVDEPIPAANEVVLGVGAYSVNRGEILLLERRPQGWRPGKDVAGVVIHTAPTVLVRRWEHES